MQRATTMEPVVRSEEAPTDAAAIFSAWVSDFGKAVEAGSGADAARLFVEDSYWRDILAFSWERPTFAGPAEIGAGIDLAAPALRPHQFSPSKTGSVPRSTRRMGRDVVEGWFEFETVAGHGRGFARLVPVNDGSGRYLAWLVVTSLHAMHGAEEQIGKKRPSGSKYSQIHSQLNWKQLFDQRAAFADRDPQVLIVGAGQGGLMLGARLRQMGVDALVVDRIARVGDNWRNRYNNLTIHNELTANNFPYLKFPETWPLWLPKDMVADWLETYAKCMELNIWLQTEIVESRYDQDSGLWTVKLRRGDGSEREMRVPHIVAAMGVSGGQMHKPRLPGLENFGGKVVHSGEYNTGAEWAGKRAIVIGTGNSGHDVAHDLHVSGIASVAMVQRGATCVISLDPCARISYAIYNEDGAESEDVDLMAASIPYPLLVDTYKRITERTKQIDADLLSGLERAGFRIHHGDDETGFQLFYIRGLGGYYIDVGCSQLIIDGKIPVIQWEGADQFVEDGLRMRDGTVHKADLVVLATGFESIQSMLRRMLGDEVADKVGPVWALDEQNNMRNMWTRTPQNGLWITGGAILESRFNSRFLALEIKAALENMLPKRENMPLAGTNWSRH